ncbi:hypothetical protein ACHAWF_015711 [Thalassiosira exigua]
MFGHRAVGGSGRNGNVAGRGRGNRGYSAGRGGGTQHSWQRKMVTKLIKDEKAEFRTRDVAHFIEGMRSFDSKPELLALLDHNCHHGTRRLRDCLAMIDGPDSVDDIVAPLLMNIITAETGRPLYKAPRDRVVNSIFTTPGVVEYLATVWTGTIDHLSRQTIDIVCEFLLIAAMSSVEARQSEHVKMIAGGIRDAETGDAQIVRRLCAVIQLDAAAPEEGGIEQVETEAVRTAACWGNDLIAPGERHDNDHKNYRDISLVPTQQELGFEGRSWLPLASGENALVADAEERMLDRNFRLLREDAVAVMRENIANPRPSKVWSNARIIGASCKDAFNPRGTSPLYFLAQFDMPARRIEWKLRRSLPKDGLVALRRGDEAPMMAAVYVRKDDDKNAWLNAPGGPVVGLVFHHDVDIERVLGDAAANISISGEYERRAERLHSLDANDMNTRARLSEELQLLKANFRTFTMTESSDSFFSYKPVLQSLQAMASVPLANDIAHLAPTAERPAYLPSTVRMPEEGFDGIECNLDDWSNDAIVNATTLDASQANALRLALTQRVALIQGPPGTGKTFIGGLVAKMIRDNSDESILCVCYTNHALDQFLEHMLDKGERKLVRIGGRTKSEELKRYELKALARTKERSTGDAEYRMRVVIAKMHRCNEEMSELLDTLQSPLEWNTLNEMNYMIDAYLCSNFQPSSSDDGFRVVGRRNKAIDSETLFKMWRSGNDCPLWLNERLSWEDEDFVNVWLLTPQERLALLNEWKQILYQETTGSLGEVARQYQELSKEKDMVSREIDSRILTEARVIGATTTGAAKYKDLLSIKSAGVVIVEEAGEVLEPHVLSSLTEGSTHSDETKHLILIGDHKQLRPKVESYELTKGNPLT